LTVEIERNQSDASLFHQRAELYTRLGDYENALHDYTTESALKHDDAFYFVEEDDYSWSMSPDFCIRLLQKDIHYLDYLYYYDPEYSGPSKDKINEYLSIVYTTQ
jgi:hypothetical protein